MVQIILIICFASLHAADGLRGQVPQVPIGPAALASVVLGGMGGLWALVLGTAASARRSMDRHGRHMAYARAEAVAGWARIVGCALHVVAVVALGWLDMVRAAVGDVILLDELLALTPIVLLIVGTWWAMVPLEQRMWEAMLVRRLDEGLAIPRPLTRWQAVWSAVRHQALLVAVPLTLLTAWAEAGPVLVTRLGAERRLGEAGAAGVQWGGVVVVIAVAPFIIRRVWNTVLIGPGDVRELVSSVAGKHRVRVSGPWLWRTPNAAVNGAILGLVYPLRYILFTDGLLEQLSRAQLEAVVAHEVAHVRRHHLIWLGVCVVASVVAAGWLVGGAIELAHLSAPRAAAMELPALAFSVIVAITTFGWVSRRFEWQADAFAARHMSESLSAQVGNSTPPPPPVPPAPSDTGELLISDEGAMVMVTTLDRVARLNGVPRRRFSFRHGSIAERQRRLASIVGLPRGRLPIDRHVRWIKRAALAALVLGTVPLLLA